MAGNDKAEAESSMHLAESFIIKSFSQKRKEKGNSPGEKKQS
jgi:hypothetical protein